MLFTRIDEDLYSVFSGLLGFI